MKTLDSSTALPASMFRTGNLHIPTSFIGRRVELERIDRFLRDPACRLLTLLGPGGVGKTRLAIESARRMQSHFADGIFWVDLQVGESQNFLLGSIAEVLALSGSQEPRQQILSFLVDKSALLVLDNFEQMLDAAEVVAEIIQQAKGVKLLVTSRAALHVQEEWLCPIEGLSYPSTDSETPNTTTDPPIIPAIEAEIDSEIKTKTGAETFDAVQLFIERVRRVRPDFSPHPGEYAALYRICQLVEGNALALELAASWARSMDMAAIAAEIERNQTEFLISSLRNVPERHRSMWAVFMHSWSLLAPAEQDTFRQLSIFRGGFRREAADAVAGATLPLLTGLVDKSLLRWQADGRFEIHALLRQFAALYLAHAPAELEQVRARHATYYLDFLHRRTQAMQGKQQRAAANEIAVEIDNIRLAWQWGVEQRTIEALARALDPLAMFFHIKARYLEAATTYEATLAALNTEFADTTMPPAVHRLIAAILSELGWIVIRLGQFDRAQSAFEECAALYRLLDCPPPDSLGTDPNLGLSTLASIRGDYATAARLAQQACHAARARRQLHNLQNAHFQLANIAYAQGNYAQAYAAAQAAFAVCQQTGDRWFAAYCLNELGQAARALGDLSAARQYYTNSLALREAFSDPEGKALALQNLGDIALRQGEHTQAKALFEQSMNIYRTISDKGGLATSICGLGKTACAQQDYATAQACLRSALAIVQEIQFTPLLLSILAACGNYFLQTHRPAPGLGLLNLVDTHAATSHELRASVQMQLAAYRNQPDTSPPQWTQQNDLNGAAVWVQTELLTKPPKSSQRVHAGSPPIPAPLQPASVEPLATMPPADFSYTEPLTPREEEVLHLIAQGLTNQEISERLHVVIGTVKAHNNRIFGKLGVSNRVQALARARELNLL